MDATQQSPKPEPGSKEGKFAELQELGKAWNIPCITFEEFFPDSEVRQSLDEAYCRKRKIVPLFRVENEMTVAICRPDDIEILDEIAFKAGCKVLPVLMLEEDLLQALERQYHPENEPKTGSDSLNASEKMNSVGMAAEASGSSGVVEASEATIVRQVSELIADAIAQGASDIHLEPQRKSLRVRYRIDGDLLERPPIERGLMLNIISRIKVMAGVDITVRRLPQDGSFSVRTDRGRVDLRVATFPSLFGEKAVLRILDPTRLERNLSSLNLSEEMEGQVRYSLKKTSGLIFVTGPTGAGKSTTLYAMLRELADPRRHLVTLENPVELQMDNVVQGQTSEAQKFNFAKGLRAILRLDPDIIMVGEVRDVETLEVAVQAALTGHLVLSTLHTNGTLATITRLVQMGLEPFMVADATEAVMAQRLIRRLCAGCRKQRQATEAELDQLRSQGIEVEAGQGLWEGAGCSKCHGTGFFGRVGIFEYVRITPSLQEAVGKRAPLQTLEQLSRGEGFSSLRSDGFEKAVAGLTTLDAVVRAVPD